MTAPQLLMTASSFMGLAVETTRGTPVAAAVYLPIESPQQTEMVTWLEDKGLRGSPVEDYGNVPGVRHAEYDVKGNVFLDTFPYLLRATLGSTDTVVTAPTSTTLSALAAAGATTISTVATVAAGSVVVVDTGTLLEAHTVLSVTGSGPFTVTLNQPLLFGHASAATVTGLTGHTVGLLNSPTTGHQPPSLTIVDYDGVIARQMAGCQADSLNLTFGADVAFAWSTKFIGNPFVAIGAPTETFSTEIFVPGYSLNAMIGGAQSSVVMSGEVDMKRSAEAVQTADGTQAPLVNWAGPLDVTGKLTLVMPTGDGTIAAGTTYDKQILDLLYTDPQTGHCLDLHMTQVQYDSPKVNRGKSYVTIDVGFKAEANTTDAIGGGYSPIKTQTGNAHSAAY